MAMLDNKIMVFLPVLIVALFICMSKWILHLIQLVLPVLHECRNMKYQHQSYKQAYFNIKCKRKATVAQIIFLLLNYLSELFCLFFLFGQLASS